MDEALDESFLHISTDGSIMVDQADGLANDEGPQFPNLAIVIQSRCGDAETLADDDIEFISNVMMPNRSDDRQVLTSSSDSIAVIPMQFNECQYLPLASTDGSSSSRTANTESATGVQRIPDIDTVSMALSLGEGSPRDLTSRMQELSLSKIELESKKEELEDQLRVFASNLKESEDKLKAVTDELEETKEKLRTAEDKLKSIEEEKEKVTLCQSNVSSIRSDRDWFGEFASASTTSSEADFLKKQMNQMKIQNLKKDSATKDKIMKMEEESGQLNSEISRLNTELAESRRKLDCMEIQLSQNVAKLNEMKNNNSFQLKLNQLCLEVRQLKEAKTGLKTELEEAKVQIRQTEADRANEIRRQFRAVHDNDTVRAENVVIAQLKDRVKELEEENGLLETLNDYYVANFVAANETT